MANPSDSTPFMANNPPGEDRFAAPTQITRMYVIGAVAFSVSTIIYGLRVFTRIYLTKCRLRVDDSIQNCVLTPKLISSTNYTWDLAYELLWFYAELAACVICASASSLKPFFRRFLPHLLTSGLKYNTSGSRDVTSGFSRGAKHGRSQLCRQPTDAYELESGDEGESGKTKEEDEAKLWSGNSNLRIDDPDRSIVISSDRPKSPSAMETGSYKRQADARAQGGKGINIDQELQISYGPSR
ncbi:hypothetical protein SLS62_005401 [Diatrype stigma]|uniref:Integral membrane protein n=1 Tax=Diatrype stigma TaxID=117547 RepID=A0AAN9USQ6_9PEZI